MLGWALFDDKKVSMPLIRLLRAFARCNDGAAALEFAIVSIPLFFLIIGGMEFGMISYTEVAVESALTQAGRTASIGEGGCDRVGYVVNTMTQKIQSLPNHGQANVTAEVVTATGTSPTTRKDICLIDPANPYPASCPGPYQENTGNSVYDPPSATPSSLGKGGDLVEIRVIYPWKILTPFIGQFFGANGMFVINSTIVIKNEPFDPASGCT
jgi:hypothetical protein